MVQLDGNDLEVRTDANLPDGWKGARSYNRAYGECEWQVMQVFFFNGNGLLK